MVWVYAAILAQTVISAGNYLIAKDVLTRLPPLELLVVRFVIAAAVLILLLLSQPRPRWFRREHWKDVLLVGMIGVPLNQGLFLSGMSLTTPSHGALLYALTPVAILVLSRWWIGERVTPRKAIGIALALGGVLTVLLEHGVTTGRDPLLGDLIILLGVMCWAAYSVLGKRLALIYGPFRATSWTLVCGAAMALPAGPFVIHPDELLHLPAVGWAEVLYLAILTSVVAYLLWYYALSRIDAGRVAVFSNLQPVCTAALAYAVQGQRLTPSFVVGGVLVIAGVAITQRG